MKLQTPLLCTIFLISTSLLAPRAESQGPEAEQRGTDIHALIERLANELDKEIVVDPRVPPGDRAGYSTSGDADYETLLAILRLNGFAAVESDEQILIVPEQNTRSAPTRILQENDSRVSDHEIVTRLIQVPLVQLAGIVGIDNEGELIELPTFQATQLVPVLRPMLPQTAQLGAIPGTNTLIIVDRYDNVRRITAVVEELLDALDD